MTIIRIRSCNAGAGGERGNAIASVSMVVSIGQVATLL